MKNYIQDAIILAVLSAFFILMFLFVTRVSAHHPQITQEANCDGYSILAEYVGGSGERRLEWDVMIVESGIQTLEQGDWQGVSDGFVIFEHIGLTASVSATGYVRQFEGQRQTNEELFALYFDGNCLTITPTITTTTTQTPTMTPAATMTVSPTQTPQLTPTLYPVIIRSHVVPQTPTPQLGWK